MAEPAAILDAWLATFVADGWEGARIDAVARAAGVSIAAVADSFPDHWSALRGIQQRLDHAALLEAAGEPGATVRDRLFTMIMARFDAAQAQRESFAVLAAAARRDPGLAAFLAATLPRSAVRIAEAAGVHTSGWLGALRVQGVALVLVRAARSWLRDDSPDLGATMRSLDAALAQAERIARAVPASRSPGAPGSVAGRLPE